MKITRQLPEMHIEGYKEMSISKKPVEYLKPKSVFIPVALVPNTEVKVKAGDRVLLGQEIAFVNSRFPYPILSPISGTVKGNAKKWHPSQKVIDMLEIENDFKEEKVSTFLNLNPEKMSREDLIALMKNSGLVGMGGAGFPAYAKYETKEKVDMVIINLAECEPFITCDYETVLNETSYLIYGLKYLMKAAGTSKGVIAIKNKEVNKPVLDVLYKTLESGMEVFLLKDCYPAGWEKYIVEKVTGKTYPMLPIQAGAIVTNATTAITFARILKDSLAPSMKYVTITGDQVKEPGNVISKIGTPIEELLPLFGGLKEGANESNTRIIAGGPMTGRAMYFNQFVTTPTLGAIIYLKDKKSKDRPTECLGCGRCASHCPCFLTPVEIKRAFKAGDMELLKELGTTKCIQCGLCSHVCPSRIDLTDSIGKAKAAVMALGRR